MLPMSRVERGADARRALALRLGCPSSLTPLPSVAAACPWAAKGVVGRGRTVVNETSVARQSSIESASNSPSPRVWTCCIRRFRLPLRPIPRVARAVLGRSSACCSSSVASNASVQTINFSKSLCSMTPCFQTSSGMRDFSLIPTGFRRNPLSYSSTACVFKQADFIRA